MSSYLKYLLLEARSEYIIQNKKLVEEIWYVLCREMEYELDTPDDERVKQVKEFLEDLESHKSIAKYLNWVVKQFINVDWRYPEDIDKLDKNLNKFYRSLAYLKSNGLETDINKYTMSSFNALMNDLPETSRQINQEKEKDIKLHQADRYYEDNNWLLLSPKTQEAAILYGKGTQWCTAATESHNYFDSYNSRGPLYILINKKNPKQKYQFHISTGSFMDITDCEVDPKEINQIFNSNPELKKVIRQIIEDSDEVDTAKTIVIDEDVLQEVFENIEKHNRYLGLSARTLCEALFNENIDELNDWEVTAEDILSNVEYPMMSVLDDFGLEKIKNEYKISDFVFGSSYRQSTDLTLNKLRQAVIAVLDSTKAGNTYEQYQVSALYEDMKEFAKMIVKDLFPNCIIDYYNDCIEVVPKDDDFINEHLCELIIGQDNLTEEFVKHIPIPEQDYEYYYDVTMPIDWNDFIESKLIPTFKKYLEDHPTIIEDLKTYNPENPKQGEEMTTSYDPYNF